MYNEKELESLRRRWLAILANMESSRVDICKAKNVSDVTLYIFEKGTTNLHRRSFLRIKRFIEEVERRVGKLEIQ